MSESDEERPLSRRERRLREMAETGAIPAVGQPPVEEPEASAPLDEPEISPVNPDGTPRSRREMRELREQALAEMRAAETPEAEAEAAEEAGAETPAEAEAETEAETAAAEPESESETAADSAAEREPAAETEAETEAEADDEVEFDLERTQAFSLQDIEEATAGADAARMEEEAAAAEDLADDGEADGAFAAEAEFAVVEGQPGGPQTVEAEIIDEAAAAEERTAEPAEGDEDGAGDDAREADAEDSDSDAVPEPKAAPAYSFPDIAPLDEGGSVFDDPAVRVAGAGAAQGGDFDDLISRAVAQEGAASSTNASALILPDLGRTGQLSGPLGETGELFITGSIDLPKSLGETGGHASLLDSVQGDPDDFVLGEAPAAEATGVIAPVSAARAVSARSTSAAVVAAPEKEKRRLPIALIATGGGLLIVIAGLAIWAASTGFFA
jgi:chemotaxis protein histidine kinase CheA